MANDYAGVQALIGRYFDGLYHSDAEGLADVFHPDARYVTATAEPLVHLGMDEYLPVVAARPAPAARGEPRRDRIVSITFAGPDTAVAIVNCAIAERHFTDLLSLIRVDGAWRIIAKVFHYDIVEMSA